MYLLISAFIDSEMIIQFEALKPIEGLLSAFSVY